MMSDHYDLTVPLIALAEAVPVGHRSPKFCLVEVECDVSIPTLSSSGMALTYTITAAPKGPNNGFYGRYGKSHSVGWDQDILFDGSKFYIQSGMSAGALAAAMKTNPLFRIGDSVSTVDTLIAAVDCNRGKGVWPADTGDVFRSTTSKSPELRQILEATRNVVFTDAGLAQVEAAKSTFISSMSDIVVINGEYHVECGEPVYLFQPGPRRGANVKIFDSGKWRGPARNSTAYDSQCRYFRADCYDQVYDTLQQFAEPYFGRIRVHEGAVPAFPLETMEYDRMARHLVDAVSSQLCAEESLLSAPRAIVDAFLDLRDFLGGYDPLVTGVPGELEDLFENLVALTLPMKVIPSEDIDYAREMWSDRPITTPGAAWKP